MAELNINSFDHGNIESYNNCNTRKYYVFWNHKNKLSELLPVLTILENCCNNNETNEKTKITKRDFNHENTKTFQFLSEHIKWDRFLSSNTPNKAYNKFWKMSLTYSILLSQKGN